MNGIFGGIKPNVLLFGAMPNNKQTHLRGQVGFVLGEAFVKCADGGFEVGIHNADDDIDLV